VRPIGCNQGPDRLDRNRFRAILDVGLACQTAELGLFARIGFHRCFESLIAGTPKLLAQRIVVANDTHRSDGTDKSAETFVAHDGGSVALVVPEARLHVHEAVARARSALQGAKLADDFPDIEIEQAVLDVVGSYRLFGARDAEYKTRLGARHFVPHGA